MSKLIISQVTFQSPLLVPLLSSPNASENLAGVQNPEELVLRGGLVEVSCLLINKEGVRHPYELDVLCPNNQLFQAWAALEGEPWVLPKLAEIHVQGEVLEKQGVSQLKGIPSGGASSFPSL
jgi:hypothetical protein